MRVIVCVPVFNPHQRYLPTLIKHLHRHGFEDILLVGEHTYEGCQHVYCSDRLFQMYKRYLAVRYCLEHYSPNDMIWFMDEDDDPLLDIKDIPNNPDNPKIYRFKGVNVQYIARKGIVRYNLEDIACTLSYYVVPISFYYETYEYLLNNGFTTETFKNTQAMEDTIVIIVFKKLYSDYVVDIPKKSYMHLEARSALYNKDYDEAQLAQRLKLTTTTLVNTSLFIIKNALDSKENYGKHSSIRKYGGYTYYLRSYLALSAKYLETAQEGFDRFTTLIYLGLYLYEDPKIITFPEETIKAKILEVLVESAEWVVNVHMGGNYDEFIAGVHSHDELVANILRYKINIPKCFTSEQIEAVRRAKYLNIGIHEYYYP